MRSEGMPISSVTSSGMREFVKSRDCFFVVQPRIRMGCGMSGPRCPDMPKNINRMCDCLWRTEIVSLCWVQLISCLTLERATRCRGFMNRISTWLISWQNNGLMSVQHVGSSRPSGCDLRRCRQLPKGLVLRGHSISISTLFGHSGLTTSQFSPGDLYLFRRPLLMAPIRTNSPRCSQRNPKSRPASLQIPNAPSPANDDIKIESGYLMEKMLRIVDLFEEETKWSHTVCKAMGCIV